ncbi:MAG: hypothetical protein ACETWR_19325 [Anaerolineae bacterium]
MDHIKVLKRAWEIIWRYRVLWVFGIIVALTTGGGAQYSSRGQDFAPSRQLHIEEIPPEVVNTLIAIGIGLACVIVILIVASAVARYVAETALIRMVDDYEETGEQRSVRQGFRMGWSRTAFRLFLIKLLIGLPTALVFILLFALAAAPLLLWATKSTVAGVIGTVAAIGLFFLILFLVIVVTTVLSLLRKFFWRACALEELGVIESIRRGFDVVRQHLKDVGIMWLIMIGVQIGWAIAMIVMTIMLLPAIILLIIVAAVLGGLPGLLVFGLTSLFFDGVVPWILAAMVGIPIFALIVAVPWLFLGGLMEVFKSSVWTLTYRELRALESLETQPEQLPQLDTPDLE